MTNRGALRTQADSLAEAAVQKHFDTIRTYMAQNQAWNADAVSTLPTTTLMSNDGANRNDGSYSSQASLINTSTTNDVLGNKQVTTSTIQLTGTGRASNGTTSRAYSTFTVTQEAPMSPLLSLAFDATVVIQSNTTVTLNTNGGFRTHSSGNGVDGSILANGGVIWTPASGNKGSNPNSIVVDGQILTGDATSTALTIGPTGIGNANGTKNYQTNAATAQNGHPIASINAVTSLGGPRIFPDAVAVATWKTAWSTAATLGLNLWGTVNTNSAPYVNGERRITAPAYIHGDLNVDSGQLYLQPSSNPLLSNVVYVDGNIKNSTLLYNRGVVLVCTGKYTATNSSAQYALQTQSSPYTMTQLYAKTALVSLATASDAINMGVNASSDTGLIYATLGGIVCQANNNFRGVLVAGGTGTNGGVIAGGANSFDITFTPQALAARTDFQISLTLGSTVGQINKTSVTSLGQFFWEQH